MNIRLIYICILLLFLLGSICFFFYVPSFHSTPHPATSYKEALEKFALIESQESLLPLSQAGHSRIFVHDNKREHVFVLLHGLTSCPEEFLPLGKLLFKTGGNVVILRAKDAGFADVMNQQQGEQSGQDLIDQAARSLDIASGLGNKVSLVGISAGAVSAAWMAEHRPGIDTVLLISPFFAAYGWSLPLLDIASLVLAHLPNFYFWKNKSLKAHYNKPSYAYPRFGTQSIASTLLLAKNVSSFNEPINVRSLGFLLVVQQFVCKLVSSGLFDFSTSVSC